MPHAPTDRRRWLAGALGCGLAGCAQLAQPHATAQPPGHPAVLPHAQQQDWRDGASGHVWRVWVQPPAGPAPAGGHPLLVLLDGNAAFAIAAQLARNSAARPADMRTDNAIVVGIGHPGDAVYHQPLRQRDYTPPAPHAAPTAQAGGADLLLDFITQELQPHLARQFPTDPQRQTLYGHSFGGLLVLHALFTRPQAFNRYAAASPSVWWNQGQILQTAEAFIASRTALPPHWHAQLQLRWGALETASAAPSTARAAILQERRLIERTQALAQRLQGLQWPALQVQERAFDGLDHGDVMAPALIDALTLAQRPRTT